MGTLRLRLRSNKRQRGVALVESAIIGLMLIVMIFGIFEFSVFFRDYLTTNDAADVAAREGAAFGSGVTLSGWSGDMAVVASVRNATGIMNSDQVNRVIVWKADPNIPALSRPPDACTNAPETTKNISLGEVKCNIYPGQEAIQAASQGNTGYFLCDGGNGRNCGWPSSTRNDEVGKDVDFIGVYVETNHVFATSFVTDSTTIRSYYIKRLEVKKSQSQIVNNDPDQPVSPGNPPVGPLPPPGPPTPPPPPPPPDPNAPPPVQASAPGIVNITPGYDDLGNTFLTVEFTPPQANGGSKIVRYEYTTDGRVSWRESEDSGPLGNPMLIRKTSLTGANLAGGVNYNVGIRAVTALEGKSSATYTVGTFRARVRCGTNDYTCAARGIFVDGTTRYGWHQMTARTLDTVSGQIVFDASSTPVDYLVVGGGGGGGAGVLVGSDHRGGGGGGGGGRVIRNTATFAQGVTTIRAGSGGAGAYILGLGGGKPEGQAGESSQLHTFPAAGGGGGASRNVGSATAKSVAASGGGGATSSTPALVLAGTTSSSPTNGHNGGNGCFIGFFADCGTGSGGGGGGGAETAGGDGLRTGEVRGGTGGNGVFHSLLSFANQNDPGSPLRRYGAGGGGGVFGLGEAGLGGSCLDRTTGERVCAGGSNRAGMRMHGLAGSGSGGGGGIGGPPTDPNEDERGGSGGNGGGGTVIVRYTLPYTLWQPAQ